jgi:hypothetical protein
MKEDFPTNPPLQGNINRKPLERNFSDGESLVSLDKESHKQTLLARILEHATAPKEMNEANQQFIEEQVYAAIDEYTQISLHSHHGRQYFDACFVELVRKEIQDSIATWSDLNLFEDDPYEEDTRKDLHDIHNYARNILSVLENGIDDNVINLFE